MRFRFDDVSVNENLPLLQKMTDFLFEKFPDCEVIYGVSPLVWDMSKYEGKEKHRVYPKEVNPLSKVSEHYYVDKCGIPEMDRRVLTAGHGIVHQDHRLFNWQTQELSIMVSCRLVDAVTFIPPFNKWDSNTETICEANGIELIKWEDGWRCMEYEKYDPNHDLWYLHARELTFERFVKWFEV